jgi:hypothetical protein
MMSASVFPEIEFWLLITTSLILPVGIYGVLLKKKAISRLTVLLFGLGLVLLAGVVVYLLQTLTALAKLTPSLLDNSLFVSEMSVALYLLPVMFAGTGINLISHIIISHLVEAEAQFDKTHTKP